MRCQALLRTWNSPRLTRTLWLSVLALSSMAVVLLVRTRFWINDRYRPVQPSPQTPYHVAYPHPYSFILDEPDACPAGRAPFLVLVVPVAPGDLEAREAIRRTWGSQSLVLGRAVRLFFLLGLPSWPGSEARGGAMTEGGGGGGASAKSLQEKVEQESRLHRDLLQSDFQDSYFNLTIKTMMMLEWLASRCRDASFAMKIDSDMFLNVHNLVQMLTAPDTPTRGYITGQVARGSPVLRDVESKWFLPRDVYPAATYPPYVLGYCYVFSMDLPRVIVQASKHVRAVHIEDVNVAMCLSHEGVLPTEPPQGSIFSAAVFSYSHCQYPRLIATMTSQVGEQQVYWTEAQKTGFACGLWDWFRGLW